MPNLLSDFLYDRLIKPRVDADVAKAQANNRALAYGVVTSDAQATRAIGQQYTIDHALLYAIYKLNADVFGCVQKWMGGVTTTGWHIEPIDADAATDTDKAEAADLTASLKHSNPFQQFTELLKETVMHLGIAGDAYWYKIPQGAGPA